MVIVIAVIAILSAIMVPNIVSSLEQARVAKAASETATIGKAILQFRQDMGRWPNYNVANPATIYTMLTGDGILPAGVNAAANWNRAPQNTMAYFLIESNFATVNDVRNRAQGLPVWNGPYLQRISPDPWGQTYLCNVGTFAPPVPTPPRVYVISTGPNRLINTPYNPLVNLVGDDIGFRLQ